MNRKLFLVTGLLIVCLTGAANAAVFTVTPSSGSDCSTFNCDLQSALNTAAANGQDDTINVAAGTYGFPSTVTYIPSAGSGENYALSINGAAVGTTIIDVSNNLPSLIIDTTKLSDCSKTVIHLGGITLKSAADVLVSGQDVILGDLATQGALTVSAKATISVLGTISTPGSVTVNSSATLDNSGVGTTRNGLPINIGSGTTSIDWSLFNIGSGRINFSGSNLSRNPGSITVAEGQTVTLNAANLVNSGNLYVTGWTQISGATAILSASTALSPTFIVPTGSSSGTPITFQLNATSGAGTPVSTTFTVNAIGNGISGFPLDAVTFKAATGRDLGIRTANGSLTSLTPLDPVTLPNDTHKPADMIYGLLDFQVKVAHPGDTATVTVLLPAPAPAGYKWFKYNALRGWYDYSDHAVFSADRTQITLTVTDGGIGDDDGVADGLIRDPSGLGAGDAPAASAASGSGHGCFIATAAYGSPLDRHVATLRTFRDRFLLTNSWGTSFVRCYYRHSPPMAQYIARHDILRFVVRACLLPIFVMGWVAVNCGIAHLLVLLAAICAGFGGYAGYRWKRGGDLSTHTPKEV